MGEVSVDGDLWAELDIEDSHQIVLFVELNPEILILIRTNNESVVLYSIANVEKVGKGDLALGVVDINIAEIAGDLLVIFVEFDIAFALNNLSCFSGFQLEK